MNDLYRSHESRCYVEASNTLHSTLPGLCITRPTEAMLGLLTRRQNKASVGSVAIKEHADFNRSRYEHLPCAPFLPKGVTLASRPKKIDAHCCYFSEYSEDIHCIACSTQKCGQRETTSMTSGGLLQDPKRLLHDVEFQKATLIQLCVMAVLLILSAFYHYILRPTKINGVPEGCVDDDIAEVDTLIVYPIKSCRGLILDSAQVSRKGFQYDRRWAVIKKEGLKKLNLKVEPRLTHVIPSFDHQNNVLNLEVGDFCDTPLPKIGIPLNPSGDLLKSWTLVDLINMYGDTADGRVVPLAPGQWDWKSSPSDWMSKVRRKETLLVAMV